MAKKEKYVVGVDLGGTYIKIGVVNAAGKIFRKITLDTFAAEGPEKIISQIKKGIYEILDSSKIKLQGIGIGSPGVVTIKKGTVENPPNFPGWGKINLGRIIEKEFETEVDVENDANAAAIGEMIFGAGKNLDSFVMITLGTGVGGGIILNRHLFRGQSGGAGEIGHITIDHNGYQCNCGSKGCIETYAGVNYLVNRVKAELEHNRESKIWELISGDMETLSPKLIDMAAEQGDVFAQKFIKDLGNYLGSALASVSNLLDISTFIIGGGVAGFGKPLFDSIQTTMKERVLTPLRPGIRVIPAKLKNDAGIKGASALVFYKQ
jgi:glucokinase